MAASNITNLVQEASGCSEQTARYILDSCPDRGLSSLTPAQLKALGATEAQARRLVAALRLGAEIHTAQAVQKSGVRGPGHAVQFFRARVDVGALEQEQFWVIALNARQKPLDLFMVAVGSLSQVDVHPREIFKSLVRMTAHSCILVHNHPSNDPDPSAADWDLTHRMVQIGKLLGIPVLDHIVITANDSRSLASSDGWRE
jgi:DNA repair protein RadC